MKKEYSIKANGFLPVKIKDGIKPVIHKPTNLFSLRIPADLYDKAAVIAEKERRSLASVINQALAEFLERREQKSP